MSDSSYDDPSPFSTEAEAEAFKALESALSAVAVRPDPISRVSAPSPEKSLRSSHLLGEDKLGFQSSGLIGGPAMLEEVFSLGTQGDGSDEGPVTVMPSSETVKAIGNSGGLEAQFQGVEEGICKSEAGNRAVTYAVHNVGSPVLGYPDLDREDA